MIDVVGRIRRWVSDIQGFHPVIYKHTSQLVSQSNTNLGATPEDTIDVIKVPNHLILRYNQVALI